jgi:hypothetical protein
MQRAKRTGDGEVGKGPLLGRMILDLGIWIEGEQFNPESATQNQK